MPHTLTRKRNNGKMYLLVAILLLVSLLWREGKYKARPKFGKWHSARDCLGTSTKKNLLRLVSKRDYSG